MTPQPSPPPKRPDASAMLQVTGGMAAIAIALAIWVDDRKLGPVVDGRAVLVLAFLAAGLAALIAAMSALGMLLENVALRQLFDTDVPAATVLSFLALALLLLGGAYIILLFTLSP